MTRPAEAECEPREKEWERRASTVEAVVLVVDDNPVDRRLAGAIIERRLSWKAVYASDGAEALSLLERETPSIVLTDMIMPEMGGLELVEAVRQRYPLVPVVLMTAYGSEDAAMKALRSGAASYVPKRGLPTDLIETLRRVLTAANRDRRQRRLLYCLTDVESHFTLDNDPSLVAALAAHLQEQIRSLRLCDDAETTRFGIALEEALLNGLYHGNLECGAELRRRDAAAWRQLVWDRGSQVPYRDRRLRVGARLTRTEASFTIQDDGPGFDASALPDATDPGSLGSNGRGLTLIRTFMDEVRFNERGNEITLVKRRRSKEEGRPCVS